MLSKTILNALNSQIAAEFSASNLYLSMAAWCENNNLSGFSVFLFKSSNEERCHGLKIYHYILEQMGEITIGDLQIPKNKWENITAIFEDVLSQEQKVTALINNIAKLANAELDFATLNFLNWFIDDQVKSENEITDIVEKLKMIGNDVGALLYFDNEINVTKNGN